MNRPPKLAGYGVAVAMVVVITAIAGALSRREHTADVAMAYLLGVTLVALRFGLRPSLFAGVLSVLAFDFVFIPPYFTFAVADHGHIVTFAVMLFVATLISSLTTRSAQLASQAHEAQRRVEAEELRNALLSSVSHDLRTPLAVITGTASTLLEPHLDEPTRRDLTQAIVDEAGRLDRVVRNLLDMTRLEAGPVRVHAEWQPIEEAIGAALDRTSAALGDRPIVTKLDHALVPYDSVLLQQVLVNLLENASKYTPPGSPLEITAAHDTQRKLMTVGVLDRGPGLAPGDVKQIFEKFYRANRTPGGVGLGLTICRAIVAAHGGTIWAESRDGRGTAFYFTLPMLGDAPAAVAPELGPEESAATS